MRRVAGAVPVRKVNDKVEYLFVKSSKVKNRYLFPKGGVDRNERPKYAAIRETYEVTICDFLPSPSSFC
jgi:8-oxo-dGTP pyrophosphatase MutT (NUDIX family)